jgi:hypothetical protein
MPPFSGSGSFSVYTPGNPTITGTTISSTAFNNTMNDFATGLSNTITRDGQSPATAAIPMGNNKITGLANGTARTDAVSVGQVQDGGPAYLLGVAGTNTITASLTPAITAYAAGQTFRFVASGANTGAVTINVNGLGAKAVTKNGTTALVTGDILLNAVYTLTYDGTQFQISGAFLASGSFASAGANSDITSLSGLTSVVPQVRQLQPISASVAANALTISASALSLEFRSATLTSGAVSFVQGTPANLVISSGSTLGTVSAQQSRIVVLALNNAGTIELAAVNISGGNDLSETGLISTTAEGGAGAADSANVIYSTTARSNVAYRVIGYIESTQATAGTWATAPSTIQGYGGQALAAMSSLGYGQNWQVVTGSRALGTTYYNTTGKPITVVTSFQSSATFTMQVNGNSVSQIGAGVGTLASMTGVVPPGMSYNVNTSGGGSINTWCELR